VPKIDPCARNKSHSLNHLIGGSEQFVRDAEAEHRELSATCCTMAGTSTSTNGELRGGFRREPPARAGGERIVN
jgi:hypothetical protein